MENILRIDLTTMSMKKEKADGKMRRLGGRGLVSVIIHNEVNPLSHPLSADNKIVIAPGLLAGTYLSSANRLSVGAKSPLTEGIKECNSGGIVAFKLGRLGIKAVILEGKLSDEKCSIIKIDNTGITFEDGGDIKGLDTYSSAKRLFERYGKKAGLMIIGPAGENRLPIASINVVDMDGEPCRILARGGLGAVMGSKGVKAIVIDDENVEYGAEKSNAGKDIIKRFAGELKKNPVTGDIFPNYGTANTMIGVNALGGLPTRNFSSGCFEDSEKIDGRALHDTIIARKGAGMTTHGCMPGCVIRCSNKFADSDGNLIVSSLEYETLCLLGSNIGIGDLDQIAILNRICNEVGIDTIEAGAALGVMAEGGLMEFGNCSQAKKLLEEVGKGTPLGRLVAGGCYICGKVLGVERVPAVKKQSMAAYDPRVIKGTGVTYATSPMGADHTAGNTVGSHSDSLSAEEFIEISKNMQINTVILDSLGLCIFTARVTLAHPDLMLDMLEAMCHWRTSIEELSDMAKETINMERSFNLRAGISEENDSLPDFMSKEKLYPTDLVFDIDNEKIKSVFKN